MIYRIYTEDLKRQEVLAIITKYYQGFTIFEATGFWKLKEEKTIVIEIISKDSAINIKQICEELKTLNEQESVLVVKVHSESSFI